MIFAYYLGSICPNHLQPTESKDRYRGFLSHGGTPSHHPFLDGIFHEIKPAIVGYPHDELETPIERRKNHQATEELQKRLGAEQAEKLEVSMGGTPSSGWFLGKILIQNG